MCHMPCVVSHVSNFTCHMLYFTCNMSYVISHMVYVTYIICHLSYVICCTTNHAFIWHAFCASRSHLKSIEALFSPDLPCSFLAPEAHHRLPSASSTRSLLRIFWPGFDNKNWKYFTSTIKTMSIFLPDYNYWTGNHAIDKLISIFLYFTTSTVLGTRDRAITQMFVFFCFIYHLLYR